MCNGVDLILRTFIHRVYPARMRTHLPIKVLQLCIQRILLLILVLRCGQFRMIVRKNDI